MRKSYETAKLRSNRLVINTLSRLGQCMKPQEFIPEEQNLAEWSSTDDNIVSELKTKGYQYLGSGVDQTAFLEPESGLVLKIFGTQLGTGQRDEKVIFSNDQKMFFKWADFCMKHKNNPFLPKFYGFESFIFNEQTYLQIRQERLYDIGFLGWGLSALTDSVRDVDKQAASSGDAVKHAALNRPGAFKSMSDEFGKNEMIKLLVTVFDLHKIGKQHGFTWDLHGGNYMMRADGIPVIVDPWLVD